MTDSLFSKLNDYLKILEDISFTKPISKKEKVKTKPLKEKSTEKRMFRFTGVTQQGKKSDKFWEVWVEKNNLIVRFGMWGSNGQIRTKEYPNNDQAIKEMEKRIKEKIRKGYKELEIEKADEEEPFEKTLEEIIENVEPIVAKKYWNNLTQDERRVVLDLLGYAEDDIEEDSKKQWSELDDFQQRDLKKTINFDEYTVAVDEYRKKERGKIHKKFNPEEWEHGFEGGEIVEAHYRGTGFIGKVVRVSKERATNPKSVRIEPIGIYENMLKALYPKTPYTIPKIHASTWHPFNNCLVPLSQEELFMYNEGDDIVKIWKNRKRKGIDTMGKIWIEYNKELRFIKKIKPFFEFLHDEFPISFPTSENDYKCVMNFVTFFGKYSDNNFQINEILNANGVILEFDEIQNDILKGGIIYAKLVKDYEEVVDKYKKYSEMDDPAYLNEKFEMLLWNFENQSPFRIYHIKSKVIKEDWYKKEKQEELREEVEESLEEFTEEHKIEFEERVKEIKKIYWDLSDNKFKSSLERKMAITDINFVMKDLKSLMENEEDLISYGYDNIRKRYYLEYDSTKYNEFLIKLISHLIEQITQRKITLKTIKPHIDEIKERMETYRQVEKKKAKEKKAKVVRKKKEVIEEKEKEYVIVFEEPDTEDLEQELEENILGIICSNLINSDYNKVFQGYIFKRIYDLGYQDSDFGYIRKKLNELEKKNIIKKEYTYRQGKPYYVLGSNKKLCEEKEFETNPVDIEIPLLYEYPNISSFDIGKRVIVQILCHNSKQSNKNRGSYIDTLKSKWLRFFQYTYKPKDKPEDYHYLKDDVKLKTVIEMESKFKSDLDELLKDKMIVSTNPPPKYIELIRLQKDYAFIWKTYKFGIFSEIQEISGNTLHINKERIDELKNLKEYQNIKNLVEKIEDYYCIAVHRVFPMYLVYDRTEFSLRDFENYKKDSSFNSVSLGMNRKILQNEIIKYFQSEKGFHKIAKKNYRKWKGLRTGKLITLAVALKF